MDLPELASIDDLATLTGKPVTDGRLALALRRASNRFRGAVEHPVSLIENDEIVLDGNGSHSLLLPAAPVVGRPTVTIHGEPVDDFEVSSRNAMLRRRQVWPSGLGNITVTYTHGHETVPGDIADAVLEQAHMQAEALFPGLQTASAGGLQITLGAQATIGVTQRWSEAVERHRLNQGDRS